MADTFNKKEREKKKDMRRKEKAMRKETRKENSTDGSLDNMIAYVDEFGNLSDTPPDPKNKVKVNASSIEIGIPRREDDEDYDPKITGVISYYDDTKGYGFIKDGSGENYFMHFKNVNGTPVQGKAVEFEKEKGPKGWTAVRVVVK